MGNPNYPEDYYPEDYVSTNALARLLFIPTGQAFSILESRGCLKKVAGEWRLTALGKRIGGKYGSLGGLEKFPIWPQALAESIIFRQPQPVADVPQNNSNATFTKTARFVSHLTYTKAEEDLLSKHLQFYIDLDKGHRIPSTEKQKHFVKVCRGLEQANTPHELAYLKYKRIQEHTNKLKLKATISRGSVKRKSNKKGSKYFNHDSRPQSVKEILKDQDEAMKLQAIKRLNVKKAMAVHSDPND